MRPPVAPGDFAIRDLTRDEGRARAYVGAMEMTPQGNELAAGRVGKRRGG